jgi:hypothetical protein
MMRQPSNEQYNNLVMGDSKIDPGAGSLSVRGWAVRVGVNSERYMFEAQAQARFPAVPVAKIIGIVVRDRSNHADHCRRCTNKRVVRLERRCN